MKKLIYSFIATLALCVVSSCKKYVDVNVNPNAPTSVDASTLLPPMQAGMARGVWFDSRYIGQYAQIWGAATANNVWDQEGYIPGSDSGGEMWRTIYFSLGQNVTLMWQDAIANKKYDYIGVGWALRAWGWANGGDLYNYMIVKEAFDPTRLTFDYDAPQVVYAEAMTDAQTALNNLNLAIKLNGNTSATLAKGDYMYYGDLTKWVKFVYAIMAQVQLHMSNKSTFSPTLVQKYVDSSFTSNADNASVQCNGSQSGDSNFWGPTRGNIPSFRQSDYIVRLLDGRIFTGSSTPNNTLDPRLPLLLAPSKDGVYRGEIATLGDPNAADANTLIPALAGATTANSSTAAAKYIFNDNSRGVLMTYSELQFMKSEALFKNGDLPNAYTAYINGIKGALDFASNPPIGSSLTGSQNYISAAAQAAYLAGPCVRQSPATLQLSDILQQKFISLFVWNPLEAWADERRYQYSASVFQGFTPPGALYPDNAGKQVYVMRPRYNSEYIWNVPALKSFGALAPDYHTTKPWFILP
ncbi:MAG: SusD/RagB family nutrient-binding outer membrane lipoprotein [Mucilaginibacter sp.]